MNGWPQSKTSHIHKIGLPQLPTNSQYANYPYADDQYANGQYPIEGKFSMGKLTTGYEKEKII